MKTFVQFIKEATETLASTEAKNRGLVGDGHGDWYDKQGKLIAKTVGGKLKYFGQGDKKTTTRSISKTKKHQHNKQHLQHNKDK